MGEALGPEPPPPRRLTHPGWAGTGGTTDEIYLPNPPEYEWSFHSKDSRQAQRHGFDNYKAPPRKSSQYSVNAFGELLFAGSSSKRKVVLFENNLGEQIQSRWRRMQESLIKYYLDEFGNVVDPSLTHGISVTVPTMKLP